MLGALSSASLRVRKASSNVVVVAGAESSALYLPSALFIWKSKFSLFALSALKRPHKGMEIAAAAFTLHQNPTMHCCPSDDTCSSDSITV